MASIWPETPTTPRIMNLDTTVMEKKKKKSSVFLCGLKLFTYPKDAEAKRWKELYVKPMEEEIKSPSSPAIISRKVLEGNKTAGPKKLAIVIALPHRKLKLKLFKCQRKALRSHREQLILIKAKDDEISSLKTALAEMGAEAQKWKELYLKRGEEIKSLKLANQAKEYNCGREETSSDNHFKSSRTTSVYDKKKCDGPKPRYDKDYVSGHHTNSNPAAG